MVFVVLAFVIFVVPFSFFVLTFLTFVLVFMGWLSLGMTVGMADVVIDPAGEGEEERRRQEPSPLGSGGQDLAAHHAVDGKRRVHERELVLVELGQTPEGGEEPARLTGEVVRQGSGGDGRLLQLDTVFRAHDEGVGTGIGVHLRGDTEFRRPQMERPFVLASTGEAGVDGHADGGVQDRRTLLDRLHRVFEPRHPLGFGFLVLQSMDALLQFIHVLLHLRQLPFEGVHRLVRARNSRGRAGHHPCHATQDESGHCQRPSHRASFAKRESSPPLIINNYQLVKRPWKLAWPTSLNLLYYLC